MSIGAFTIIKNEAHWVGFCVMAARDTASEFVYFDGNSTDGTVILLRHIAKKYGINIKVVEDQDPKDLRDDYVRVFNDCLKQVRSEYAWFLHPDMIVTTSQKFNGGGMAYYTNMASFAGEPHGDILQFDSGRNDKWKNLMMNDFGLHYFGHYGVVNEDLYFSDITGSEHILHDDMSKYPYFVSDSGIHVNHYSDVRDRQRRLTRMASCLQNDNPSITPLAAAEICSIHPRVTLRGGEFGSKKITFSKARKHPAIFKKYNDEFAYIVGKKPEEFCYLPLGVKA